MKDTSFFDFSLLLLLTTNDTVAGKLFPYSDFFKWLCYANGLCSSCSLVRVRLTLLLFLD